MRVISALILLGVFCIACALPPPTTAPTTASPPTAQSTGAAVNTPAPTAQSAPTQALASVPASPSATRTKPAPAAAPTQSPAAPAPAADASPEAPRVSTRFHLNELPGEGRGPVALTLLGERLYVANRGSSNLGIIVNDRVQSFIPLDAPPSALVSDPARNRIIAGSYETPTLFLLEDDRVTKAVAAGGRVNSLALDGDQLYVALDNDALIERYDANTLEKQGQLELAQGFGISDLVLDKPRNRLYAAEYGRIVAIDLTTFQELNSFAAPYLYTDFAVNPADGSIWSGAYDDESSRAFVVGYVPDGREIARLYLGSDLQATTFDDAGLLYVLDRFSNQVHVIRTPQAELVATLPVNEAPSDAIFDPARRVVLVSSQDNDNVSVIELLNQTVTATIPLANNITALAANPDRLRLYAANASTNSVYAIEGDRVVAEIKTGVTPVDLAVDPASGRLFIASRADGLVTMVEEDTFQIVASQFITRALSTVAMDTVNRKLFAGPYTLDPQSLLREELIMAQGVTLNSQTTPRYERPNPALRKLYAIASNGVPGSNSRLTLFRFLYDALDQSKLLGSGNGGNTTSLAIDPATNNLFAANFHPLGYISGLDVFDADDNLVTSLPLVSNAPAMVVNPDTHHLFIAFAQTYQPIPGRPVPRDNTVQILDTNTLGLVGELEVSGEPIRMALLNQDVAIASARDGSITVIRDGMTSQPPPPSPTATATPWQTWTFTPSPTPTTTPAAAAATTTPALTCAFEVAPGLANKVEGVGRARLGCPIGEAVTSDKFAFQPFTAGFMVDDFRDQNSKRVTVLFPDKTWRVYSDTWQEGQDDRQCLEVPVEQGHWRPKRGFGSVWCNVAEVQALGGGLFEERGVALTLQSFEQGTVWSIPDVGDFVLLADGTWE